MSCYALRETSALAEAYDVRMQPAAAMPDLLRRSLDVLSTGGTVKLSMRTGTETGRPPHLAFQSPYALSEEVYPKFYIYRKDPEHDLWIEYTDQSCRGAHDLLSSESAITARLMTRMRFPAFYRIMLFDAGDQVQCAYLRRQISLN